MNPDKVQVRLYDDYSVEFCVPESSYWVCVPDLTMDVMAEMDGTVLLVNKIRLDRGKSLAITNSDGDSLVAGYESDNWRCRVYQNRPHDWRFVVDDPEDGEVIQDARHVSLMGAMNEFMERVGLLVHDPFHVIPSENKTKVERVKVDPVELYGERYGQFS